jgi:hypothetical protein
MSQFQSHFKRAQGIMVFFALVSMSIAVLAPKASAGSPGNGVTSNSGSQAQEQNLTEVNQLNLDKVQPAPQLQTSLERANLIAKLKFTNNSNQLGYVYLLGLNGNVIANYTIKGKVSSLNSMLTTTDQVRCPSFSTGAGCNTVTSPDLDGSYGNNPSGIFFFTTAGVYVEWSGTYIYSSEAMNITTPVTLTETVK